MSKHCLLVNWNDVQKRSENKAIISHKNYISFFWLVTILISVIFKIWSVLRVCNQNIFPSLMSSRSIEDFNKLYEKRNVPWSKGIKKYTDQIRNEGSEKRHETGKLPPSDPYHPQLPQPITKPAPILRWCSPSTATWTINI